MSITTKYFIVQTRNAQQTVALGGRRQFLYTGLVGSTKADTVLRLPWT